MPIREYICPKCKRRIELIELATVKPLLYSLKGCVGSIQRPHDLVSLELVEFSVPARRNPKYGEQR
jgi:hypothetical protein